MQKISNETKMEPKEYNKLLKHINISNVILKEIKSTLHKFSIDEKAKLEFEESAHVVELTDDIANIEISYSLKAIAKRRRIFVINAKYIVVFGSDRPIPKEFFDIYNEISLPLQTFPYFRELVNSTISKMGLPPLILPLRKFLVGDAK